MKNGKTTPMCVKCGETDTTKISTSKRFKNGYRSQCKACDKAYYEANKEARLLKCKEYRDTKLDKVKAAAYNKQYREDNAHTLKVAKQLDYINNSDAYKERARARKAMKLNQTPILTTTEKSKILLMYKISASIKRMTGVIMNVDHIIPLAHGGLHHPLNLQVITQFENLSKGSKMPSHLSQELKDLHNTFYGEIKYE